jgi:CRP/FNR family nitrogen fixation transcriptional regulator
MLTRMAVRTNHISSNQVRTRGFDFTPPHHSPLFDFSGPERTFCRNEPLFREGDTADRIYQLVRGVVRSYKLLTDGQRQIEAFRFPGDIFGLEFGAEREFSAEAINDVAVVTLCSRRTADRAKACLEASNELYYNTANELRRVHQHASLLKKNAQQRVASFLLEMSDRFSGNVLFALPMSRQDIADYLGLTIETVSRSFTQLEAAALIDLPTSRQVLLRNADGLRDLDCREGGAGRKRPAKPSLAVAPCYRLSAQRH